MRQWAQWGCNGHSLSIILGMLQWAQWCCNGYSEDGHSEVAMVTVRLGTVRLSTARLQWSQWGSNGHSEVAMGTVRSQWAQWGMQMGTVRRANGHSKVCKWALLTLFSAYSGCCILTLGLYSSQYVFPFFCGKMRWVGLYSGRLILEYIYGIMIYKLQCNTFLVLGLIQL